MGADWLSVTVLAFLFIVLLIIVRKKIDKQEIEFVNIRISGKKFEGFELEKLINLAKDNISD